MKTRIFLAQLLLVTVCGAVVLADDKADNKNLVKEYLDKFGQPGTEHKLMEPLVGHFNAKVRLWMDPAQEPKLYTAEVVRKPIFEGRFIVEEVEGNKKDANQPYRGIGFLGYDRGHKKWEAMWVDSMDTAIRHCHGTYDESNKTWTFKHEGKCPITSQPVKTRETLRIVNGNEQQMEFYRQLGNEKEVKAMEITLTREKKVSGQ
jgi:hypothetical protein